MNLPLNSNHDWCLRRKAKGPTFEQVLKSKRMRVDTKLIPKCVACACQGGKTPPTSKAGYRPFLRGGGVTEKGGNDFWSVLY